MKVRYTNRAFKDREAILTRLKSVSPTGARRVLERFDAVTTLLAEQPSAGVATDISGVRVLFVGRYPYKLFYRQHGDEIQILHIRHTARLPIKSI